MSYIIKKQEALALNSAKYVFAESNYTKNLYADLMKDISSLKVIAPSLDVGKFKPISNYDANEYILSVGRFSDKRKNLELLLQSYSEFLKISKIKPNLVIVSQNQILDEHYKLIKELELEDKIIIKINLNQDELIAAYQFAKLFILPSLEEGLGIVLLEAMSCGVPVVSTKCGGPESIINEGENGYIIDSFEPQRLANRLQEILENSERLSRLSKSCRDYVLNNYSTKIISDKLFEQYKLLLS
jgi:glycosyltransferase involved in cell wall biosynthesis